MRAVRAAASRRALSHKFVRYGAFSQRIGHHSKEDSARAPPSQRLTSVISLDRPAAAARAEAGWSANRNLPAANRRARYTPRSGVAGAAVS